MLLGNERRELALLLREAMERDGLRTVEELSRRIGIPAQRLRSYMREECKPRHGIRQIAHYLGMTVDQLMDRINRYRPADVLEAIYQLPSEERWEIQEKLDKMRAEQENDDDR